MENEIEANTDTSNVNLRVQLIDGMNFFKDSQVQVAYTIQNHQKLKKMKATQRKMIMMVFQMIVHHMFTAQLRRTQQNMKKK